MIDLYHIGYEWDRFETYKSKQARGLLTGFPEIDKTLTGFPGFVCVVGEPKSCKSTFVMNIAMNKAIEGHPVILLDKENGLNRTRIRMLCYLSGLTYGAVRSGNFWTDAERVAYAKSEKELRTLPIYYFNSAKQEELEDYVREAYRKHRKHVLLVADSIQSLAEGHSEKRAAVDSWVYRLNDLKIKCDGYVTILMVSEKKREAYGVASRSGAKESGSIEYKAELVLDLYQAKDQPGIMVDCTYNRDGDTGIVTRLMKSEPYTYKVSDCEYLPED